MDSPTRSPREIYMKLSDIDLATESSEILKATITSSSVRCWGTSGGKVGNFTLQDDSGLKKFVLWNEENDKYQFTVGDIVTIKNFGVVKVKEAYQARDGLYEIRLKPRSEVTVVGKAEIEENLTKIDEVQDKKIGDIISILGQVENISDVRTVSTGSKIREVDVSDESGKVKVSIWGDHAESFPDCKNKKIIFRNIVVKQFNFVNYASFNFSSSYVIQENNNQ